MNKYFVFSDESGHWTNKKHKFYVRCWLKIDNERYLYLTGLWRQKKLPNITHSSLLKNSCKISDYLEKENFEFFFSITKLNEFYERKWSIRDSVALALSQLENQLSKAYEKKIPHKLEIALNQVLFLNVYEKFHLENAIESFNLRNEYFYEFRLNKPQFTENDYLEIFDEIKNKFNIKANLSFVKNNENELGICFTDALSSMFKESLETENMTIKNENIINFLKNKILNKGVGGKIGIRGINKIFYPVNKSYGKDVLKNEEDDFLNHLRNIFN